ncbi:hypothetical protein TgHK011_001015 [Trichoderma gracile]|nr:hypothetical protein TgHK011_001015 [Trichoderma gracile]
MRATCQLTDRTPDCPSGPGGAFRGARKGLLAPCTGRAEKSISWTPHRRDMPFGCAAGRGARYLAEGQQSAVPLSGWGPKVWTPTAPSTPGEPGLPTLLQPVRAAAVAVSLHRFAHSRGYLYGAPSRGLHVLRRTRYLRDAAVIDVDVTGTRTAPADPYAPLEPVLPIADHIVKIGS